MLSPMHASIAAVATCRIVSPSFPLCFRRGKPQTPKLIGLASHRSHVVRAIRVRLSRRRDERLHLSQLVLGLVLLLRVRDLPRELFAPPLRALVRPLVVLRLPRGRERQEERDALDDHVRDERHLDFDDVRGERADAMTSARRVGGARGRGRGRGGRRRRRRRELDDDDRSAVARRRRVPRRRGGQRALQRRRRLARAVAECAEHRVNSVEARGVARARLRAKRTRATTRSFATFERKGTRSSPRVEGFESRPASPPPPPRRSRTDAAVASLDRADDDDDDDDDRTTTRAMEAIREGERQAPAPPTGPRSALARARATRPEQTGATTAAPEEKRPNSLWLDAWNVRRPSSSSATRRDPRARVLRRFGEKRTRRSRSPVRPSDRSRNRRR
eukprot:30946-Pelagococcus_subviridis.AAC.4